MEIIIGRCYRAKKPKNSKGFFNDRMVLYIGEYTVQYDGPEVAFGRKYPSVDRQKFEDWVGEDVTDKLPKDSWEWYK